MNGQLVSLICLDCFSERPLRVTRCAVGLANYVFIAEYADAKYVVRCSEERNAYSDTVFWLERLAGLDVPVPRIIAGGSRSGYEYLVLTYIEGSEIGLVYPSLTREDKRAIAAEAVRLQKKVSETKLPDIPEDWSWRAFIDETLSLAAERIAANGFFDAERAERLIGASEELSEYFAEVKPVAYLDDISTKNLLIRGGRISGIIDVDEIGIGDVLTFAALTHTALLNMGFDTEYTDFLLEELHADAIHRRAFLFYALMFCTDFMGERGMHFTDKTVEVNVEIIDRLNGIYDTLWAEWTAVTQLRVVIC